MQITLSFQVSEDIPETVRNVLPDILRWLVKAFSRGPYEYPLTYALLLHVLLDLSKKFPEIFGQVEEALSLTVGALSASPEYTPSKSS
jgi:hypothetical protein